MNRQRILAVVLVTVVAACRGSDESPASATAPSPASAAAAAPSSGAAATAVSPGSPAAPPEAKSAVPAADANANTKADAEAVEAQRRAGADDFEVAGVASAVRTTRLSMKAGGLLSSIKTREGVWVTAGQTLCSLDTTDLGIRVEGAEVAHQQALAGVQNAQQDLTRARDLYKGGAATDQSIEKAELGLTMANLQADAAKVALKAAQQALYDATLRAPFAGVITKVVAEEGMMITTMPPTVIFQLVDTSVLEVRASIPERMLAQIKVGQPVLVSLPAVKIERQAKIDRIPEVVDAATRSVEAVIRLDNKDRAIPANLYARVRFLGVHPEQSVVIADEAPGAAAPAGARP